jgi:hypothetical protein
MNLRPWRRSPTVVEERSVEPLSFDEWMSYFSFGGLSYLFGFQQTLTGDREEIGGDFTGLVRGAYKSNGVIFACMLVRQMLFSEARFAFRRFTDGRPGDLFGNTDLRVLERPGGRQSPSVTTGDLLSRMSQDGDLAGNWFGRRVGDRIVRLRPDWVSIVMASRELVKEPALAGDTEVLGYIYHPGGHHSGIPPVVLEPFEVAHFAPIPDPELHFRGMSWLTPVLKETTADQAATRHKLKFFENGATVNLAVSMDPSIRQEAFEQWVRLFKSQHEGVDNAYKTVFLGGGADIKPIGADFKQLEFKATQGAGETRIAAAAGVPPVIAGFSEGLQASTYSNYGQARRRFADGTMRPLWRNACGSLSGIIPVPAGAELWYDDRDIAFLQEDMKDRADTLQVQAQSIRTLTDCGYETKSVVAAVTAGDLSLVTHTGLTSVQLLPPGTEASNGNGNGSEPVKALTPMKRATEED